jgi:hypothetical protein
MLHVLQIVTLMLVAVAMACSLAHALELPGKLRLAKDVYLAVQAIYYPGFTIVGGFAEILGLLATGALVFLTPRDSSAFRVTVLALIALVLMHATFWVVTQPANKYWLREQKLSTAGSRFFGTHRSATDWSQVDWKFMRDKWEYSHVTRAVLSFAAVVLLACAIAAS